jgi:CRP-like cAMP-binding protein
MQAGRPIVDALAGIPFFAGLDPDALTRLAATMRTRRFRRGEVIFHVGDPGDALFVILAGEVKISLPSETGDEAILATLRPGEFFGELALLDGAPRSASASALSATETVMMPRDRFRELIASEAPVRDALLAALATELRRLTTRSSTSSTSPAGWLPDWSGSPRTAAARRRTARSGCGPTSPRPSWRRWSAVPARA